MLCSLFGLINCEVVCVGTIADAWDKISGETFDIYLLDNWLPGGSGIELCRRIREVDALTPVIFYTGADQDEEREAAMAAGAQAYLLKPSDIARLVETVKGFLKSV
jgi:DNA-binding response OmpR family regulator